MDRKDIELILAEALGELAPDGTSERGINAVSSVAASLKTHCAYESFDSGYVTYAVLKSAVIDLGETISDDKDHDRIIARIPSGIGGFNPAIVVVASDNGTVHLLAYAKEGLIKQHSAEKAIRAIRERLGV
ncbi:MAG: hypothetical protein J5685_07150 [Clostridiales bacterium]|nr:hypothetical protein [Clostridiales bacterium]